MNKFLFTIFIALLSLTVKAQQQLSYAYDDAGNRKSRTIVLDTCSAKAVTNQADLFFLEEMLAKKQIKIYPNPVEFELTISITGYDSSLQGEYSLFNLDGSMLFRRKITGEITLVDMSLFSKGTYILNIQLKGQPTSWKIIKL